MTISYQEEKTEEDKRKNYYRKDFHKESFLRSFTLPKDIDGEHITSEYKNGILAIEMPKKQVVVENKNSVNIEIK